jgi:hypothetical protein
MRLTKLSMRMDWGLSLSMANSWKDTMLEIWCSSWPARAKTVKGTQKKQTNKIELRYDLILYPQRYVGNLEFVLSTGMQKKKKLFDKKKALNYVVTWSFIYKGT